MDSILKSTLAFLHEKTFSKMGHYLTRLIGKKVFILEEIENKNHKRANGKLSQYRKEGINLDWWVCRDNPQMDSPFSK